MLYIIHGTDINQSRQYLSFLKNQKEKKSNISLITVQKGENISKIDQSIKNVSMLGFDKPTTEVVEIDTSVNFDVEDLKFLEKLALDQEIILWIGKELEKKSLVTTFPPSKNVLVKVFTVKKSETLYQFIDGLNAKNKNTLMYLNKLIEEKIDPVFINISIAQNFRAILGCKLKCPFFSKLHPYVQKKTETASKNFNLEEIKIIYNNIYKTDLYLKSQNINSQALIFNLTQKIIAGKF